MSPSVGDECLITQDALLRIFDGVVRAQSIPSAAASEIRNWISAQVPANGSISYSIGSWRTNACFHFPDQADMRGVIDLALGVAYLESRSRDTGGSCLSLDVDLAWELVKNALENPICQGMCYHGPQGFLEVHLCSLLLDHNKTDQLYRLHVWLPNDERAPPGFEVHSHQAFAQSWILAGEARNLSFKVEPCDKNTATHAKYRVQQNFENPHGGGPARRISSSLINTGELVKVTQEKSDFHQRNATYTVPSSSFHGSEVPQGQFHATLFLFDSHRGWDDNATVLGPQNGGPYTNVRHQEKIAQSFLKQSVDDFRQWETLIEKAKTCVEHNGWEDALKLLNQALDLCASSPVLSSASLYTGITLGEIGVAYRNCGQCSVAEDFLKRALETMARGPEWIKLLGELGVVHLHSRKPSEAERIFKEQQEAAKELGLGFADNHGFGDLGQH